MAKLTKKQMEKVAKLKQRFRRTIHRRATLFHLRREAIEALLPTIRGGGPAFVARLLATATMPTRNPNLRIDLLGQPDDYLSEYDRQWYMELEERSRSISAAMTDLKGISCA